MCMYVTRGFSIVGGALLALLPAVNLMPVYICFSLLLVIQYM